VLTEFVLSSPSKGEAASFEFGSRTRVFNLARTFPVRGDVKNLGLVPAVPAADHDGEHRDCQQQNSRDDQETSLQGAPRLPQRRALKHRDERLARVNPRSVKPEYRNLTCGTHRRSYLRSDNTWMISETHRMISYMRDGRADTFAVQGDWADAAAVFVLEFGLFVPRHLENDRRGIRIVRRTISRVCRTDPEANI